MWLSCPATLKIWSGSREIQLLWELHTSLLCTQDWLKKMLWGWPFICPYYRDTGESHKLFAGTVVPSRCHRTIKQWLHDGISSRASRSRVGLLKQSGSFLLPSYCLREMAPMITRSKDEDLHLSLFITIYVQYIYPYKKKKKKKKKWSLLKPSINQSSWVILYVHIFVSIRITTYKRLTIVALLLSESHLYTVITIKYA